MQIKQSTINGNNDIISITITITQRYKEKNKENRFNNKIIIQQNNNSISKQRKKRTKKEKKEKNNINIFPNKNKNGKDNFIVIKGGKTTINIKNIQKNINLI